MRIETKKLLIAAICVLTVHIDLFASKVTIDADGGAGYTSLDAVLTAIQSSSIDPDTIEFIGSDQDSYSWSSYLDRTTVGTLVIRSTQTSPDLFTIITQSSVNISWNFLQSTNLYFENIILSSGTTDNAAWAWTNAQSAGKTFSFKQCIIKDHSTDYFLEMSGGSSNTTIFENCLFEGNAKIFNLNYWDGTPTITFTNCTFDGNTEIFYIQQFTIDRATNVSLKNCIFSNNTTTLPADGILKGKTTYSLTSESTSGYGTSCVSNSNPNYASSSRANPSNWMIQTGSPAQNIGTSTGAPSTDISGYARSSPDAGCWEYQLVSSAYTWDANGGTAGYQGGSGTWSTSTHTNWSQDNGTTRVVWPGPGYSGQFAGSDGNYTITVDGTQYVDSIAFDNTGYKISGGTALYVAKKLTGAIFGFSPPYAAGSDSAKAFDRNTSTYCDDNASDTGNTGIDLGAGNEQQVSYIRYIPRSGLSEYLGRMTGGIFQGSNNGSSWTNLYTISSTPTLAWQMVPVSNTTAWRYLRYLGPANGHCNVAEIEFYGMGSIYVESGKYDTIATVLTGNSGIRKYGEGYLTLSGSNTYAGPTEIYGGILFAATLENGGSNSSIGVSSSTASNLLLNGGQLRYRGGTASCDRLFTLGTNSSQIYSSGSGSLTLSNTGSVAFTGSGARLLRFSGSWAGGANIFAPVLGDGTGGATSILINTSGTWAFTGANTYTGTTTISAGTFQIGNGGTTGAISNSSIVDNSGTLVLNRSNDYTYTGVISGAGAITKEGAGAVTLSGNLTHSGLTTVNAGTLRLTGTPTSNARKFIINSGGTISVPDRANLCPVPASVTADWITLNGGTLSTGQASGQNYGANRGFTLGASGGTFDVPYTDNTNPVLFYGVITGSGGLTKTGTGALALIAANTFTGGVTVNDGVLAAINTAALGNSANTITVNNGGSIDIYGNNLQSYTNAIIINGQISSDTGALINTSSDQLSAFRHIALGSDASIGNNGGRFDIGRNYGSSTCVTGNGFTLTKIGTNFVAFLGIGTGLGSVVVNGGYLQLERADAIGTTPVTVNTGATLTFWGSLTLTNELTLAGGTLQTVSSNSHNTIWSGNINVASASTLKSDYDNTVTLSGGISGSGSLTRTGTEGSFIISGNSNTYSGGTTISGGTLRITNTSGSATGSGTVSVSSNGTLDGTGSASGATSVSGTLAPGINGPGRLTFGTNITFSSGATFNVQLNGTTASSGYDQVVMSSGTLALGSATLSLTFGYTPTINDAYTIINNQGSNAVSGTFNGLAQGATTTVSYNGVPYDCQISYTGGTGNDVVVTVLRISAEDYANEWGFSQALLLNTTSTGANITANVLNFPVLLRLNPGNFDGFSNTQPGGRDIRFAKTNGAKLSYEIERWNDYDNDADTAEIWVKLDTVYGNNKTQTFLMYWGKSDAADSSDGATVFNTTNGFIGVWHLNEDPTGGTSAIKDASINALHATSTGSMTRSDLVDGVIGKAHDFDGVDDADSIPYNSVLNTKNALTMSAWVKIAAFQNYSRIVSRGMPTNADPWSVYSLNTDATNSRFRGEISTAAGGSQASVLGKNTLSIGTWYYVTFTYNRSYMKMYRDGITDIDSTAETDTITSIQTTPLMIGKTNYTSNPFSGIVDEVRVESSVRSADWIKLCYENQKASQSLVSYEDYSTWGFSRNITINTSGITTTNCLGFPMLVRLTSSTFDFNQARDSGQDIRFSKSNGVRLPYQIERWNKASSLAEIWVRIDTVYGSNSSQYFKMYWGKSGVTSKSNSTNVFDTANGFTGVWHLNETANTTADGYKDATANAAHGQGNGFAEGNEATAVVARGQTMLKSSARYITINAAKEPNFDISGTISISAWINISNWQSSWASIITKGDDAWRFARDGTNGTVKFTCTGLTPVGISGTTSLTTGGTTWYYLAGVYDGSQVYMYLNGNSDATAVTVSGSISLNNYNVIIGDNALATGRQFDGLIDEVRVAKIARSADWIKLCYETQKPSPTIITADSADAFRPLGIRRYGTSSAPDSIYVGTNRWALRFAKNKGGGIKFLAADSSSSNQLDANLFYIVYKENSSDTGTGTISLLDSSIVFSRIRQTKSVAGLPFIIDYSVLGSGKMYVRVSTTTQSSISGGLAFRIANNATTSYRNIAFGSTAATCDGVAHIDSTSGKYDLVMAPFEHWGEANQIESNSKYTGLSGTSWNPPAGKRYVWEFMVDFGHKNLTDSARIAKYIVDYRNSDTLGFYAGSPLLEQAWEEEENGEWQFNEGTGSSTIDKTGRGHTATISGTPSWTNGKWYSNALYLGGSDSATVPHSTDFNSTNQQHTITAWIRPDASLSSSVSILKKLSSSGVGYSFTGGASGTLRYNMSNGGSVAQLQSSQVLTPGSWYHVAATAYMLAQLDYLALYINGKLDTLLQVELDSYYGTSSSNLVIGENFQGSIDDVRYYNQLLTEEEIRTICLRGFSPERGMYRLRANNDNTIHTMMHGTVYNRFLPVMQISNYWATALPTYVYIDGVGLTSGTDYYAALDDNRNQLTIGFNRTINRASTIFIDNNLPTGQKENGPTKKMYWGRAGSSNEYFWVKNTSGRYFGSASANEFYMNWKMNNTSIKDGEIWHMRSSVTNPYTLIDTSTGTNLIPDDDGYFVGFGGAYAMDVSTTPLRTTKNVTNSFTYTVEESSLVRVRLRVNERQIVSGQSFNIVTKVTIYPTGQIFRYDSLYSFSSDPTKVFLNMFMNDSTYASVTTKKYLMRGINIYSQKYPDFTAAWLSMKNGSGYQPYPFTIDTVSSSRDQYRSGFEFCQYSSATTKWTIANSPIQSCIHIDFHHSNMNTASMDSIANGVQCSRFANRRALSMITGTLDSTTHGDFSDGIIAGGDNNGDGFNEMEGAYIINASDNTVAFKLPAKGDTCRFYPAFRIKNYTSVNRPKYVFLFKGLAAGDTVALLEGYQYNSYVNIATDELLIQIDSIFCDSVGIYISSDKTLAVELSKFEARPGNNSDTIIWRTESEQGNLGFQLFRRIKPEFYDSIAEVLNRSTISESQQQHDSNEVISLFKRKAVNAVDTGWVVVNKGIIPGAPSGNSQGPRDYRYIDRNLFNGILFEYRLIAIDEKQNQDSHGPVAVMPRKIVPALFMLGANYPNPFIRTTTIRFALPAECKVSLKIFNLQGRLVRILLKPDRKLTADYHQIFWNGKDDHGQLCSAGPFIYILEAGKYSKARVMLMIR